MSPFFGGRTTEWDTDLLFKKPWTLSLKAEFMLGWARNGCVPGKTERLPIQLPARQPVTSCSGHTKASLWLVSRTCF